MAAAAMEMVMSANTHVILEISRTPTTNATQTPQSAISNRSSIPSGSQVIELDSEDDDDDDDDDEDTMRFGYNDEDSDVFSDDDDEEDRMFEQRRQNLARMQRMQAAQAQHMRAVAPVAPRPIVPYRPGEVVDLLSDDDEPPRAAAPTSSTARSSIPAAAVTGRPPTAPTSVRPVAGTTLARSVTQPIPTPATSSSLTGSSTAVPSSAVRPTAAILARATSTPTATTTTQARVAGGKRILETPSPDATTGAEPAKRRKITVNGVEIKVEFEPKKFGEANISDEVVEVAGEDDEPAAEVEMVTASSSSAGAGKATAGTTSGDAESDFEDFQIVGGTMQVASDMPHQRYACTMHPYRVAPSENHGARSNESAAMFAERCRMNQQHCPKCYCYVCDMVVADCSEWPVHCHATHKEPKWKMEKDARNSKILSLMTAPKRAAFFKRYKDALTTHRPPLHGSSGSSNGSHYDSDEDEYYNYHHHHGGYSAFGGMYGHNSEFGAAPAPAVSSNPKDLTNTTNLVNLILAKLSKSKSLHNGGVDISAASGGSTHSSTASLLHTPSLKPSGQSNSNLSNASGPDSTASSSPRSSSSSATPATAKELFLEASELLLRTLTSPRHTGDAPALVAKAFVTWFMHPLCSLDLRTIIRNELTNAQARSMVLTSSLYQSLRELVSLDNATVLKLRQRTANSATNGASTALPPQLMNMNEQVQGLLIPELLDLGNFTAIKHLVALRPSLVPSLLLYHIRNSNADAATDKEAVSLVYTYCATRPFSTLKPSLQEIELPALFRFLAAVLAHNLSVTTDATSQSQPGLRQLQDSVTDLLFNVLFTKIYDTIKIEHADVIGASVDAYMARESELVNPIRLNNVTTWIGAETLQTHNYSPLVVVLYLKYCNWRVNTAVYAATATFSSIPILLITPAMYGNLKFPLLVVLANTFCRYFAVSAQRLDTADVNSGVHMGCHIAVRALGLLTSAHRLSTFDPLIRQAWYTLPEIKKATPGELCSAQHGVPRFVYNHVSCANNHTHFKFCPAAPFTSRGSNGQAVVPSWSAVTVNATSSMRITATYCDIHYTYDTFLMTLVVPKTALESRMAFAMWGHQLQLHELTLLVPHLEVDLPRSAEQQDTSLSGYISLIMQNREILSILWKGVLKQMYTYMHAQYHIELTSLSALLNSLMRLLKPFLSNNEILSVSQFSSHALCRDLSPASITELQAIDLNLRVCYQFSKFLSKLQQSTSGGAVLTQTDIRHFKTSLPRFEVLATATDLSAKLCGLYLLEYPTVSTRAIWHSFWRRYLLCVVSKRGLTGFTTVTDAQAIENFAISLQLEDWAQVRDLVSKAPAAPRLVRIFITALSVLPASDMTAMNYGGVSGNQVLKLELEKVLRLQYTTPAPPESPLALISDKCLENPDSALAHLVLQLSNDLLQFGALDYQPYFTYALQKKCDTARTSLTATPESIAALTACHKLVMRSYEDCVAIFHTPGRNMSISYSKVLTGLACLKRFDLVRVLANAGYEKLLAHSAGAISNATSSTASSSSNSKTTNNNATTATKTSTPLEKLRLVTETLILAHSRADFESLVEVLDPLIADAYTESSAFAAFAPVIRKFCPSSDLQITTSQSSNASSGGVTPSDSSRVKLLRFYHAYDAESFAAYWSSCTRGETEKQHILGFLRKVQNSPRFRTGVHLAVLSQLLDANAFGVYINSSEIDSPVFDKTVLFKTLLQMIPLNPYMVPMLVTAVMKILLNMASVNETMRGLLSTCCTEATLPVSPPSSGAVSSSGNTAYADARTLLLFVANPNSTAQVDALANVYLSRTPAEKECMCRVLFSKERPGALIKLLLRIRDYKQLFNTLKEAYYTSVLQTDMVPSVSAVAGVIDEVRQGITMTNLYNESNTSNSSISAFQKQLFDETSFTTGLGRFLLLLNEHHLDDRTAVFPEPLLTAVQALVDTVKRLVHNDAVVVSYLQLHLKFTTAAALQFFDDCSACNYASIPFTPMAHGKTKPSTFCFDTLSGIARAPKFFSIALSYITMVNILAATPTQNVLKAGAPLRGLLSSLVNSPCRYRRDTKLTTALASKGLLWIPKNDSAGAVTLCATELTRMLTSFGAEFAEVLEEPILLRLWAGEVVHKLDNQPVPVAPEGGPPRITLKDWYGSYDNSLMRLVEQMKPPASYSYLLDLLGLYINFNFTTFTGHLHQALSRPYAHLYRKIVLNLLLHAITAKALDIKVVLKVLCYEFHHPDNHFGLFFSDAELNIVMEYLNSSDDLRERTRMAIMSRDGTAQVPMNSLVKIPRLLELIARDFSNELTYDSFAALHHAQVFLPMWKDLASTTQAGLAFTQAAECFRAICRDFRSRTVQARLRAIFESLLPQYKVFLDLYPDRVVEIKALKAELRQIIKTKPALVKALAALN